MQRLESKSKKDPLGPGTYKSDFNTRGKSFKIQDTIYDRFGELKSVYRLAKMVEDEH